MGAMELAFVSYLSLLLEVRLCRDIHALLHIFSPTVAYNFG